MDALFGFEFAEDKASVILAIHKERIGMTFAYLRIRLRRNSDTKVLLKGGFTL